MYNSNKDVHQYVAPRPPNSCVGGPRRPRAMNRSGNASGMYGTSCKGVR
jgi:hypothetical protein